MKPCPLCNFSPAATFQEKNFLRCPQCLLIFKDPATHMDAAEEKHRYSQHNNSIKDAAYVNFLRPAMEATKERMPSGARGLDYGCGPGPALAELLRREGADVIHYDPYFFPQSLEKVKDLDFITCTEAAEHFFAPGSEFQKMFSLLKKSGFLVLMTELFNEDMKLRDWYYIKDPTHVCFYSATTLDWIAATYQRPVKILSQRLCIFIAASPGLPVS